MKNLTVTAKRDGVVFASNKSGSVKTSLHGLNKSDYAKIKRGHVLTPDDME